MREKEKERERERARDDADSAVFGVDKSDRTEPRHTDREPWGADVNKDTIFAEKTRGDGTSRQM